MDTSPTRLSQRRLAIATGAIFCGTFMAAMSNSIITVALPSIQQDLAIPLSSLQWVMGVMAMCLSALMLSSGSISDRYGRKRSWLAGVVTFGIGTLIAANAHTLPALLVGTGIIGAGGALAIPGALSLLTQLYPDPSARTRMIGLWSSCVSVALVIGPLTGGILTDLYSWRAVFLFLFPVALAAFVAGSLCLPESANPEAAAADLPGQALAIAFLVSLSFALISIGQQNGRMFAVAGCVAAVTLLLFLCVELRSEKPALPIDLLRLRPFGLASFLSFVLGLSGYSTTFLYSLLLQKGMGMGASQTGLALLPYFMAMVVTSLLFGRLVRRFGLQDVMIGGYGILALGQFGMAMVGPDTSQTMLALLFVICGLGLGAAVPAAGAAGMASAPRSRTGAVSSCINTLRQLGLTMGIGLLGSVLSLYAVFWLDDALGNQPGLAADMIHSGTIPAALPEQTAELLSQSYISGFSVAILISALVCTSGVVLLVLSRMKTRISA